MSGFWVGMACIAIFVFLVWIARRADAVRVGPWEVHAVCKCGWWTKPAFGEIFFVRAVVCPDCGTPKEKGMKLKTRRWNGPLDEWEEKE